MTGFTLVPTWGVRAMPGDPTAVAVLVALCAYRNGKTALAWPSVATLARDTGLATRTVQKALRRLEANGCVAVARDAAGGSRHYKVAAEPLNHGAQGVNHGSGEGRTTVHPHPRTTVHPSPEPRGAEGVNHGSPEQNYKNIQIFSSKEDPCVVVVGANETTTTAHGVDGVAASFADPEHREAYRRLRRHHRMPDALDAILTGYTQGVGMPRLAPATWHQIGQGILEMLAAGVAFAPRALAAFVAKVPAATIHAATVNDPWMQRSRELAALRERNVMRLMDCQPEDTLEPEPAWAAECDRRYPPSRSAA